jgi:glycosyltransferase involved in cell wall biosynthesis
LATRLVKEGSSVTLFCGNDGHHKNKEMVDGIDIVRRGGFYTVYIWAFIYYITKFRGKFDFILESANGVPFFTPLYSRTPKVLLIHHIHQEVFREHLFFLQSILAQFVESKLMPLVYTNQKLVTVSQSSKQQILKLKLFKPENIEVINPGVNLESYFPRGKSSEPSFIYLGRLKPHKNVDIAIKSFRRVLEKYPGAKLQVAGFGECLEDLKKLTFKLGIEKSVSFLGKVSEKRKIELLSKSWVALQPSMIEGWGITIIEANAAGTPVIASDVYGLRDSVVHGKTGLLAKPKNIEDFSKNMIRLIRNDRLRLSLSEQALIWSRNFDWTNSSATFSLFIKNLILENQRIKVSRRLRLSFSGN